MGLLKRGVSLVAERRGALGRPLDVGEQERDRSRRQLPPRPHPFIVPGPARQRLCRWAQIRSRLLPLEGSAGGTLATNLERYDILKRHMHEEAARVIAEA